MRNKFGHNVSEQSLFQNWQKLKKSSEKAVFLIWRRCGLFLFRKFKMPYFCRRIILFTHKSYQTLFCISEFLYHESLLYAKVKNSTTQLTITNKPCLRKPQCLKNPKSVRINLFLSKMGQLLLLFSILSFLSLKFNC